MFLIGAIRTEVLAALGNLSQEIQRLVIGRGERLSWHGKRRSLKHPLIEMFVKKIHYSVTGKSLARGEVIDHISLYFPDKINGVSLDRYLLDRSFYKPRDIVHRLEAAKTEFPDEIKFSEEALTGSEKIYSNAMLEELRLELSAYFSEKEISAVQLLFSGQPSRFTLDDFEARADRLRRMASGIDTLRQRVGLLELLNTLFSLGAVGNEFSDASRGGRRNRKNIWIFRGDNTLLPHKQMVLNRSLWKALTTT